MNNIKFNKLFLIACFYLLSTSCFALCKSTNQNTVIYFSNGMHNNTLDIKESKDYLKHYSEIIIDSLKKNNQIPDNYNFTYDKAYNHNSFFIISEITEAYYQRNVLEKLEFKKFLIDNLDTFENYIPTYIERDKILESIANELYKYPQYEDNSDLRNMIDKYTKNLKEGSRVIIVAHSQGNMFAIQAVEHILYEHPEFADSIGIISVATPAPYNSNVNVYTSANEDRVINTVRMLYGTTLDANSSVGSKTSGFLHHSFINHYMASGLGENKGLPLTQNIIKANYRKKDEKSIGFRRRNIWR